MRVKANEVRKRLAQAYEECGNSDGVKVILPPGSYAPQFLVMEGSAQPEPARAVPVSVARRLSCNRRILAGAVLAAAIAAGAGYYAWSRPPAPDRF